eukprot:Mrub_04005.p1 GENE.Mrub_04005~~Mrub_04005.p1  ORF type:complete len:438 (-),score=65.02 Mrub_04005:35-1234(-)
MLEEYNQISSGLCNAYLKSKEYETFIQNKFNENNILKYGDIFDPFSILNNESTCWKGKSELNKLNPQTCFGDKLFKTYQSNTDSNSKQLNSNIKYSPTTINRIINVLVDANILDAKKLDAPNEEKEETVYKKCNDLALLNLIKKTKTHCIMFNTEENQYYIKKDASTENGECHEVKTKDENNNQDSTKTNDEKAQCEIDESIKIKLEDYGHIKPGLCNTYFYKKVDEYENFIMNKLNENKIVKYGDIFEPFSILNNESECKKINVIQEKLTPQTCFGDKLFKQWNSGRPNSKYLKNSIISYSPNTINRIINKLVDGNILDAKKWNAANETISNEVKEETVYKKCNDLALLNYIKKTSKYCLEYDCKEGYLVKLLENSMKKRENGECYTDSNSIKNQAGY